MEFPEDQPERDDAPPLLRRETIGLLSGPLVFGLVSIFEPFFIPTTASAVLAGTAWIAIWWMTEAVPIPVTSLLPIVLFSLSGAVSVSEATAPYADPIIFLLLGGFLLALAIEEWNLHQRIALSIVARVGVSPNRLLFGFMLATASLSMWISNTATAMMMVPIGVAVVAQFTSMQHATTGAAPTDDVPDAESLPRSNFGIALMLAIAYSASIGGAATLIGSPPNAVFAGVASSNLGIEIGFLTWMLFALPASAVFLLLTWVLLIALFRPEPIGDTEITDAVQEQLAEMGPLGRGERRVLYVFILVAAGWILRPFVLQPQVPAITDTTIALIGGVLLFIVPVNLRERTFLLEWDAVSALPWGVLLLLGAGFSIANAFQQSGLDDSIAQAISIFANIPVVLLFGLLAAVVVFLTEINSNTATATVFMPIMISLGLTLGIDPIQLMALTALSASFAFMLPVATPPNAIVFGSGYLTIPDMVQIGVWLNLLAIMLVAALAYLWVPVIF